MDYRFRASMSILRRFVMEFPTTLSCVASRAPWSTLLLEFWIASVKAPSACAVVKPPLPLRRVRRRQAAVAWQLSSCVDGTLDKGPRCSHANHRCSSHLLTVSFLTSQIRNNEVRPSRPFESRAQGTRSIYPKYTIGNPLQLDSSTILPRKNFSVSQCLHHID